MARIGVRVSEDDKVQLARIAARHGRSVSSMIQAQLEKIIKEEK